MTDREFPGVEYVNLSKRCVLLCDGAMLPVIKFWDEDGDECEPHDAVSCSAGRDDYGWISCLIMPEDASPFVH